MFCYIIFLVSVTICQATLHRHHFIKLCPTRDINSNNPLFINGIIFTFRRIGLHVSESNFLLPATIPPSLHIWRIFCSIFWRSRRWSLSCSSAARRFRKTRPLCRSFRYRYIFSVSVSSLPLPFPLYFFPLSTSPKFCVCPSPTLFIVPLTVLSVSYISTFPLDLFSTPLLSTPYPYAHNNISHYRCLDFHPYVWGFSSLSVCVPSPFVINRTRHYHSVPAPPSSITLPLRSIRRLASTSSRLPHC